MFITRTAREYGQLHDVRVATTLIGGSSVIVATEGTDRWQQH